MNDYEALLNSDEFISFVRKNDGKFLALIGQLTKLAEHEKREAYGVSILVGRYLERLDLTNAHTEKTRKRIASILQRFCGTFGAFSANMIPRSLVACWISQQGWGRDMQNWVAVIIERVWAFGASSKLLGLNPIQGLKEAVWDVERAKVRTKMFGKAGVATVAAPPSGRI